MLAAVQDQKIRNLKIVGQLGLELPSRITFPPHSTALIEMDASWSDPLKVEKRVIHSAIETLGPVTYAISLENIPKSTALIEYIVSPLTINISKFPLIATYHASQVSNMSFSLGISYKVSSEWKNDLSDCQFTVTLTDPEAKVTSANASFTCESGVIEWRPGVLPPSSSGDFECTVQVATYAKHAVSGADLPPLDHVKVTLKSVDCLLSNLQGQLTASDGGIPATRRLMLELIISPNS